MDIFWIDDVSAIVLDIGQHTTKVGYAGETVPTTVLPTIAAIQDVSGMNLTNTVGKQESNRKFYFELRIVTIFPQTFATFNFEFETFSWELTVDS